MMKYLNSTKDDKRVIGCETIDRFIWYVHKSFAVHPDGNSHTGAVTTFDRVTVQSVSVKQKLNTRSSTECELVAPDDVSTHMLWTKLFMEWQDRGPKENELNPDNTSTIRLQEYEKRSRQRGPGHWTFVISL